MKVNFLIPLIVLLPLTSTAGLFQIKNRSYGSVTDPTVIAEIDSAFNQLETEVNANLPASTAEKYLEGMANSTSIASSGLYADYTEVFNIFYLAAGGGVGVDLGNNSIGDLVDGSTDAEQFAGLSGMYNLNIGFNLGRFFAKKVGFFDFSRSKFYFGFAGQKISQDNLDFDYSHFSLMGQYKLIPIAGPGVGRWNGVDITTGLKSTRLKLTYANLVTESIAQPLPSAPGNPTMNATFTNTINLGADINVLTLPLEISSGVRVLYIFDLYGGLGIDINTGSAKSIISAPGSISATESSNLLGTFSGDTVLDLGESAKPDSMSSRYFVGMGFDFRLISLVGQYTKSISDSTHGISLSLRAHY